MNDNKTRVLAVNASGRSAASVSRQLSRDLIAALDDRYGNVEVASRDLADGVPFVDQAWIEANFTPEESRSAEQREALGYSDSLVAELQRPTSWLLVCRFIISRFRHRSRPGSI